MLVEQFCLQILIRRTRSRQHRNAIRNALVASKMYIRMIKIELYPVGVS